MQPRESNPSPPTGSQPQSHRTPAQALRGLTNAEAAMRLAAEGPNELPRRNCALSGPLSPTAMSWQ
jgi:hypothetical protein